MRKTSRIALNLGLAALIGLAANQASRADDTEDLEASIRAFEDEKRAELDDAIAEVSAVLNEQRQELERIQDMVAKSEAALRRLEAFRLAIESIDANQVSANPVSAAEPVPVGEAMPPLPTRTTPDSVALTASEAIGPACCSSAKAAGIPDGGWKPGAAKTKSVGVRVLALPDGTLRVAPPDWTEVSEPSTDRPVSRASATAASLDAEATTIADTPASEDQATLIALLQNVLERLDALESQQADVPPPPPTPGTVFPSPSSIVPTP